jgi:hypothetical protein
LLNPVTMEEFELPELTPEIMMKMLANMQANGIM